MDPLVVPLRVLVAVLALLGRVSLGIPLEVVLHVRVGAEGVGDFLGRSDVEFEAKVFHTDQLRDLLY